MFINYSVRTIIVPYWSLCFIYPARIPKCFLMQDPPLPPCVYTFLLLALSLASDWWITQPRQWHCCAISHYNLLRLMRHPAARRCIRTGIYSGMGVGRNLGPMKNIAWGLYWEWFQWVWRTLVHRFKFRKITGTWYPSTLSVLSWGIEMWKKKKLAST